jgi:hypothetical protein
MWVGAVFDSTNPPSQIGKTTVKTTTLKKAVWMTTMMAVTMAAVSPALVAAEANRGPVSPMNINNSASHYGGPVGPFAAIKPVATQPPFIVDATRRHFGSSQARLSSV